MYRQKIWRVVVVLTTITVILYMLNIQGIVNIPRLLLMFAHYTTLLTFLFYTIRRKALTTWIMCSMFWGVAVGYDWGYFFPADTAWFTGFVTTMKVIPKIFLKLIKSVIGPLLFGTLVVGIAGHADLKQVGRMGLKSLIYFEVVTTIALIVGLVAINITQAGAGFEQEVLQRLTAGKTDTPDIAAQSASDIILHIFPENIAKSVAEGQVLQIVVFSVLFAIGLAMVADNHRRQTMLSFAESLSEVMFKFTNLIMYIAPIAVFAAIAYTVVNLGIDSLKHLIYLLLTLYGALLAFVALVLVPIGIFYRIPLKKLARAIAEPVEIAFSTTSSEAALPKAMAAMENIGVPRKIVAFVMPTGYSFNLDGTTLYLALATIFVAQVAGIDLSITQQVVIGLTLMLTSKGVAGVPRASLIILLGTAASFGLPNEPILMIMGIDALMDMGRSAVNVVGNCMATAVIARIEGEFDDNAQPVHYDA